MKTFTLHTILLCLALTVWTNSGVHMIHPADADPPPTITRDAPPEEVLPSSEQTEDEAEGPAPEREPEPGPEKETPAEDTAEEVPAEEISGHAPEEGTSGQEAAEDADEQTPSEDTGDGRYAALTLSEEELEELACLIWLEARGEPFEGQVAVAEVVLNRMLSPDFPETAHDVIWQRGQFTPAHRIPSVTPEETQRRAAETALDDTSHVLAADVLYFSGAPLNDRVAAVIGSHYFCAA